MKSKSTAATAIRPRALRLISCALAMTLACLSARVSSQDYKDNVAADHAAIRYGDGAVRDRVATLAARLASGELAWPGRDIRGILPDLLRNLDIGLETQLLVFSKTSLQAAHISPDRPRAIYFADDVAVAYAPGAESIELAAQDPTQGTIFYELRLESAGSARVTRRLDCLRCHQGPNTAGVPGVYIGSVIPGPGGAPLRDDTAIITDHRSPFATRWGGWYVTARRGEQPDRANAVASNPSDPSSLVRESRQNLPHLMGLVNTSPYATSTSDIVALMTFEHQTQMLNLITRVGWLARIAAAAGDGDRLSDSLKHEIEDLIAYMLFEGEPPLPEPIEGVSSFTRTFPQHGQRDAKGRSLRDFDLTKRLFRYPLSFVIYSPSFNALPSLVLHRVYERLHEILEGDPGPRYAHLSRADRRAIAEILTSTVPAFR